MGIKDVLNKYFTVQKATNQKVLDFLGSIIRPGAGAITPQANYVVPRYPFALKTLYEVSYHSDLLTSIHTALRNEIFRNGFEVVEAAKTDADVTVEGDNIEEPDEKERSELLHWMREVNENGQTYEEVLKELEDDLNIMDDAYALYLPEYEYNRDGEIVDWSLQEFLRADPKNMALVLNKQDRPGVDDKGNLVLFCPEHRDEITSSLTCRKCDKKTLRAHYKHETDNITVYYSKDEVVHVSKYRPGRRTGFSPVVTVWQKVFTLYAQDQYIYELYEGRRPPKGMLVFSTANKESVKDAWGEMVEIARENPHLPGVMSVQPPQGNRGEIVKFIDFMKSLDELNYTEQREEYRRTVGAVFKVSPVFQNDTSTSGGLNNEGLQVTVTNRGVEIGQAIYNEKIHPRTTKWLKTPGWVIRNRPSEEQDENSRLERQKLALENAGTAAAMGLSVEYDEDTGEANIKSGPVSAPANPFETGVESLVTPETELSGSPEEPQVVRKERSYVVQKAPRPASFLKKALFALMTQAKERTVQAIGAGGLAKEAVARFTQDLFNAQRLQDEVSGAIDKAYMSAAESVERKTDENFLPDSDALNFLQGHTFDNVKDMTDEVANNLRAELERGLINGEGTKELRDRVNTVFNVGKQRAEAIARTEVARAQSEGALDAWKNSKYSDQARKYVQVTFDDRTSEVSKQMHRKYGSPDKAIPLDEDFEVTVNGKTIKRKNLPMHVNERDKLVIILPDE